MSQTPQERLREYLGQLPPNAQALLVREFERSIERGQDVAVATFVLDELRKVVRPAAPEPRPRAEQARPKEGRQNVDPLRRLFRPLEPFLSESTGSIPPRHHPRAS